MKRSLLPSSNTTDENGWSRGDRSMESRKLSLIPDLTLFHLPTTVRFSKILNPSNLIAPMPVLNLTSRSPGLIISCQAPADSPMHEPSVIAAMAAAAANQGAIAVRIESPAHVTAVRSRVSVPIIGLWKQQIAGFEVYITPQFHHAQTIAQAGANLIAIDATLRPRPDGETLETLIARIHAELGKPVMADVDTLEAAIAAEKAGADVVGTTLYGYTEATRDRQPPGFDLLAAMVKTLSVPVICEGGITSAQAARQAIDLGAAAVVVGTAITGVDLQVKAYQAALKVDR